MSNIAIVYYSQGGATAMIAHSVAQGVNDAGAHAQLISIEPHQLIDGQWHDEATLARLANADAIIFGAPAFQGGIAAPFKAFADATLGMWRAGHWRNKVAGGFAFSCRSGDDKRDTLEYFAALASVHGMVWADADEHEAVPRKSASSRHPSDFPAVVGQGADGDAAYALDPADVIAGKQYGRNVAALVARLAGEVLESPAVLARRALEAAERRL
ncbi:flavodoxin family protein [Pandoraea nosoerga]|uniref:Flavoprotein WrbA n=1 Tax=Pandoraea nosoerga TaxID=2508296 RepID=A0A5E4U7E8_9BURK|nr:MULTISPECIES: flavodoxin family protein [Pandoraea]MBN4667584.1 flavodoxin family protein [Pandoraea nosoerga]MBN4676704.1 flavodoxin family protein [Pandoraea nosoerga]MBN4682880.1 flavodoxin family protein [Pandoraea nosoerga]MBN4746696.1 flavodoxin family protein [Pandoraea nosoerga]VVD95935.1 flavodoxin family protein [Pandoraea nosoerga]